MTIITARRDLAAVAREYAAQPDEWPFAPRFDPRERWFRRLAVADDHEVWLLTWLPGQHTDLHDHGGSAGAFAVVRGEVVEETVHGDGLRERTLRERDVRAFGPHHVHRVANRTTRPAVTVHAYGPALTAMTRYSYTRGRLEIESVTRAGADW